MVPENADRRRSPRYALRLRVESEAFRGVTRDVSRQGVYVEADREVAVGTGVAFRVVFPGSDGEPPTEVQLLGRVTRSERLAPGLWGLALSVDDIAFGDRARPG